MSLADQLRQRIAEHGPMPLENFMAAAVEAYYARGVAFGAAGDFITAPDISQVFGEILGVWSAVVWQSLGGPQPVRLIELGPGRGTLMTDALRAAGSALPAFTAALDLHLVEGSRALREQQRTALGSRPVVWHDGIDSLPAGPMVLLANEFLDALPIVQRVRTAEGWQERRVVTDAAGNFVFEDGGAAPADIQERSPAIEAVIAGLAARLRRDEGAALFIDYGYSETTPGDTLQALRRHAFVPPLQAPGEVDLTAHVDFAAVRRTAEAAGALVYGPIAQGRFLASLGIEQRAAALIRRATPAQATAIDTGVRRLLQATEMGTLFKVLAITGPNTPPPPGFEGLITP